MCCWKVLRTKVGDRTKAQILLIKTHCSFQICIFCLTVLCSEAIISEEVIFRLAVFSGIGDRWAVVNSSWGTAEAGTELQCTWQWNIALCCFSQCSALLCALGGSWVLQLMSAPSLHCFPLILDAAALHWTASRQFTNFTATCTSGLKSCPNDAKSLFNTNASVLFTWFGNEATISN